MLISTWAERYDALRDREICAKRLALYERTAAYLVECLGDLELKKVTPRMVDDWRAWLRARGLSESTVASHMARGKAMLQRAVVREEIRRNPFAGIRIGAPVPNRNQVHLPSAEEVRAIIESCPSQGWRCLIGLCAWGGLRRSEALRVTPRDVGRAAGKLLVRPAARYETTKQRDRVCRLEPELAAILPRDHPQDLRYTDPVSEHNLHDQYMAILKAAGMKPYPKPFQALRAWRDVTWKQVWPEYMVDRWMGHSLAVSRANYLTVPDEFFTRPPRDLSPAFAAEPGPEVHRHRCDEAAQGGAAWTEAVRAMTTQPSCSPATP